MNAAVKILKALRWLARSVVLLGIVLLLVWGIVLASWQGFSPDGTPPGFKSLPRVLFALLVFPRLFWLSLVEVPWISRPIASYVLIELVWRFAIPPDKRRAIASRIQSHASAVLVTGFAAVILYGGLALYAHRNGPAEFCVLNASEFTCDHVVLEGEGFAVPLGTLLRGERRLAHVRPKGKSSVIIRCQVDGSEKQLSFTGGLEDSRKYYYQFTIAGDLRGEYGAWRLRDRPGANDILVSNSGSEQVTNVVISGLGFSETIARLPSGAKKRISVHPMGPAIVSVEYFTPDGSRHVQSWGGWGREGHRLILSIGEAADLHFRR
ncbi:MAG: hypothetical protein A2X46_04465 [Lentisphaerae bacterium GWF2_57_35]|nr:MAG: hypothetical protein A2X46_04465 [Lentisphaerae bacterium GWF2_57_35]